MNPKAVPSVSVTYAHTGRSTRLNELGMRPMQERAYAQRGEPYLLIKSPPASGKSRALMFIALDKLHRQGLKQAIIVVPEKSIGASFNDEPLSEFGFFTDWRVPPKWNLCNAPGEDGGKIKSVRAFLDSTDQILVCTHATFRFAVDQFGVAAFDERLIAVDEFHHVSANPDNKLGAHLGQFIARNRVHIVAMTGSYFRGDAEAVLGPEDEARFESVTYTYYEQLNGYQYLKQLDIGYYFYSGAYAEDILKVLNPDEKTIIHIPNVNSRESTKDKIREVEHLIEALGEWQGTDPTTGFHTVQRPDGRVLRIADLVDDDPTKRERVAAALKAPAHKHTRDHVDIIIALGMAKEGSSGPQEGLDYGPGGYDPTINNVGVNEDTGEYQVEIRGLATPHSPEAQRVCREDLNELIAAFVQDKPCIERGLFDEHLMPEELTQLRLGTIIQNKYPTMADKDREAVRQHAIAALNLTQQAKAVTAGEDLTTDTPPGERLNTAFIYGVRQYVTNVRDLNIDLIDRINPFGEAYAILSKAMSEQRLHEIQALITAKRLDVSLDEARELAQRALVFKRERGRLPTLNSPDPWEQRMAQGIAFLQRKTREAERERSL